MDYKAKSMEDWTESDVSQWLHSIRLKKEYIDKLFDEEVSGTVLKEIDEPFLKKISMKQGPIQLLLKKRDEIILEFNGSRAGPSEQNTSASQSPLQVADKSSTKPLIDLQDSMETTNVNAGNSVNAESSNNSQKKQIRSDIKDVHEPGAHKEQQTAGPLSTSNFRPFDKEVVNFKYVKNQVLSPETGIIDMITPCHEYKSLTTAAKLDRVRLQAKFASEVIRFGSACLNMRTNGTIHFGVMDSVENKGFQHGQIVGIPVNDKDVYVDALDYIEKCFNKEYQRIARSCIRPPKFIEVIEKDSNEQNFIVEVDVVPHSSAVIGMLFSVSLPKYNEKNNKVSQDKKTVYQRVGAKSEPVSEENYVGFIQGLQKVDLEREKAELSLTCETATAENLRRKLVLLTRGKEFIDDTQWYILVTNKWESNHLEHLDFLLRFNIFCVFDFDANSDETGLCLKYSEHHARNVHSLISYSNESGMNTSDLKKFLGLFDQTSWIFCNGRSNYLGGDQPCDENTWIKNKKKYLKKAVSLICDELFPKGCFMVLFLLLSPVEKPIVEAFHEFYAEMNGVEDIVCIAENRDHYEKWANLAQTSCNMEILGQKSIFGIQLSHIDATVQNMFPLTNYSRTLPVSSKGVCILEKPIEEKLHSLEVLCVNECNDKNLDLLSKEEIKEMEAAFYRGGKITWKHFWLAEQNKCGQFIEREACSNVQEILNDILHKNTVRLPVARIQIFHHPGSGGSTMARQVLWKNRKDLRCAIVKSSNLFSTVSQHAVKLREYEEENPNLCLPVLLLVEDCEDDFLDDLRHDLSEAMTMKKITSSKPCFILLSCKRSNAPEQHLKVPPFEKVAVTHKLSTKEKQEFSRKLDELKTEFENIEFLITFVLMSKEFDERYVTEFVQNVLRNIDHASDVTRLMRYVALLNCYVHNSYISLSHCEAFLGLGAYTKDQNSKLRQCNFSSCLTEQAKLLFIELKESTTYITSIHIIHPLIAKEVLNQLSGTRPQNEIAKDLLEEKVLLHHRFGRDEFLKFIRDLFLRRHRKSRGDSVDSFFSPLIEHVCKVDKEKAINLLKAAYERLDRDAYFAQQLARLHYTHEQFEEAKKWAEIAKSQLPNNSIILDTEGQVYKKWFHLIMDKKKSDLTPDEVVELIEIGLKSMQCFRAAQKAAKSEMDSMNNSGYIAEVDIGCRLLQLLSIQACFSKNKDQECTELFDYLSSSYIPKEIEEPWFNLHGRLKGLYRNIYDALEWLADDVGYFQSDMVDSGEPTNKTEEHIHNPRLWLLKKTKVFAKYFSPENSLNNNIAPKSQLVRKMTIYKLGGGSTTSILSLLSDGNNKRAPNKLENIIDLYPQDVTLERPDDLDLINYIMCHIALACVNPKCSKILPFQKLRELSKLFLNPRKTFPPSAYLLVFLLFWPDDQIDKKTDANKEILNVALNAAKRLHEIRIKNVPVRKKRTNVLFFHGHGNGFEKIKHRSTIEKLIAGPLNERRMKWDNGEVWDIDSVHRLLKAIPGWTENGKLYAHGHNNKQAIEILPLNYSSVPHGNENVTFYLAFSYIGPVAYNIQLQK